MITFLPYADFNAVARVLDDKRLGQQRREALWVLNHVLRQTNVKAVAVRFWNGYQCLLTSYILSMCHEWQDRGNTDNIESIVYELGVEPSLNQKPLWLGDAEFHRSHQSNLKRKNPVHYHMFDVPNNLPYIWPEDENG